MTKIPGFLLLTVASIGFLHDNCMASDSKQSHAELVSKLLSYKVSKYNSYLSRMRRSAQTTELAPSQSSRTKFRVGDCTLESFLHSAKNCSHAFYSSVRQKSSSRQKCGQAYKTLRSCIIKTLTGCIHGSIVSGYLNEADQRDIKSNFLVFFGNEQFWCDKGGLGISSDYLPVGSVCDPVFHQVSEGCTAVYQKIFNSTTPDARLCHEYHKAKKCFLQTIFQHCSFSRMLQQILEIMVEFTADFQPFCKTSPEQELIKIGDLFLERTCPPHSLADVAFALDVTNATTRDQFLTMKRMMGELTKRMNYGWNGIQVSVSQFDLQLRSLIKFGGTSTKAGIQRSIRKMRRTATSAISKNKWRRMTGRSLSSLARGTFSPSKDGTFHKQPLRSGQRPHNTAVAFVFTTGPSFDTMLPSLELLRDRGVHVVFAGPSSVKLPSPSNKILSGPSYPMINTDFNYSEIKEVVPQLVEQICHADRKRQWGDLSALAEGQVKNSRWGSIQNLLFRFGIYDMSLLFELKPILPTGQAPIPLPPGINGEGVTGNVRDPISISEADAFGLAEEDFNMDGDGISTLGLSNGMPSPTVDYMGQFSFFYLTEHEYPVEYEA